MKEGKMGKEKVILGVEELIAPILEGEGLELFDVELQREPRGLVLRIFIDSERGVDLNTCARMSELIGRALDEADLISTPYTLEVSSPGIERRLTKPRHYRQFIGSKIKVKTIKTLANRRQFTGILKEVGEHQFTMECEGELMRIPFDLVSQAHLVYDFKF
ncbi:MAG: ribosome maturation factor RimP [Actinomycetota bacterium]|nr:ribosome maturation factor RimP [Actinomycetota bacterium]